MGNCGITLTSATRVFLMEPCLDPGHEVQCAGRIHRLGQTKRVLCKRYCVKDTFESAVCLFHDQVKALLGLPRGQFTLIKKERVAANSDVVRFRGVVDALELRQSNISLL